LLPALKIIECRLWR